MRKMVWLEVRVPSALNMKDILPYVARKLRRVGFVADPPEQDVPYLPMLKGGGWGADVFGTVPSENLEMLRLQPVVQAVREPRQDVPVRKPAPDAIPFEDDEPPGGLASGPPPLSLLGKIILSPVIAAVACLCIGDEAIRAAKRFYHLHLER